MKIAFITDIHFGRLTVGAEAALLADLRAQKPDLILIGGDVTQRGFTKQYRECQEFLKQLSAPWLCVIGNHDVPAWNLLERFIAPYHAYQKFITRDLNPTWVNDTVAIRGLNSARRMMRNWAWEQGAISDMQLRRTAEFFAQHRGKINILMVHHPITHPIDRPTKLLVENHTAAVEMCAAAGVDIILTGHLHRANIREAKTILPNIKKPMYFVQGGTALCDRLRGEENSYWMISIENKKPEFMLRNFNGQNFA